MSKFFTILLNTICFLAIVFIFTIPVKTYAKDTDTKVEGKIYTFGEKDHYDYLAAKDSEISNPGENTYGTFSINANIIKEDTSEGITSYIVTDDKIDFTYSYSDELLNAEDDEWHLVKDKSKKVSDLKLDSDIKKGAIILQTSKDGATWINDITLTNIFEEEATQEDTFYTANNIQLSNGCYYRLIVAYKTGKKIGQNKFLKFKTTSEYEYKKTAEVYEFYLQNSDLDGNDNEESKKLGTLTKTKDKGYTGSKEIGIKDAHYGWTLGQFFISGYTRDTKDDDKNTVFLKNVGDEVTLWFDLEQDITALNGNDRLSISSEEDGYDQYFQTDKMNMRHGTLIIRYTDDEGVVSDPEIYTNYLEANASTSADTIVKLFEEGDYEVALDYEVKNVPRKVKGVEVIPEYSHYRIYFTFSVRNGNCMVYPFDISSGSELIDQSITENGFKLDMAKSKYLTIDVQYATVTEGKNGYSEDVRFNRPAKDGDSYTDEGIYTFTVSNQYTKETTTKTIYVGDTSYMKALSVNKISVPELNKYLNNGATINTNGTIQASSGKQIHIEEDGE